MNRDQTTARGTPESVLYCSRYIEWKKTRSAPRPVHVCSWWSEYHGSIFVWIGTEIDVVRLTSRSHLSIPSSRGWEKLLRTHSKACTGGRRRSVQLQASHGTQNTSVRSYGNIGSLKSSAPYEHAGTNLDKSEIRRFIL